MSRQATVWTVVAYVLLPLGMLMDGAQDGGIIPDWEPGWAMALLLAAGACFVAGIVLAARGARPGPACTTGSRRRFYWLAVLAGVPALWAVGVIVLWLLSVAWG